ncbi:MAG: hypothetical protein HeimC3_06500 [Candidatus Heimdallarchaeota archaeon LC_3]|nr:MAG: hypothetical protein HeimC3_06500 [Candidatus Heimdallarchaeota archaeon LC_3]
MSSWLNASDLESTLGHKILIAGLQEAGKTAIKRVFFLRQKAVDVDNLKATIDYERMAVKINDTPLTVVDLGGQRIFIKRFLNSFSPFIFNNVKVLIFVIDVSLKSTRNNSVQYFSSCLNRLSEFSKDADIYVFLHKNDLIRNSANYESIHEQLKEEFQLESTERLKFFRTTIFEPSTIIEAFGRIFEINIPSAAKSKFVNERTIGKVEEFADKFAVMDLNRRKCPQCENQLFDTDDGIRCSVCDYHIPKIEDKSIQTTSSLKISVEDLQKQLNDIKVEEEPVIRPQIKVDYELADSGDKFLTYGLTNEETDKIINSEYKDFFNLCINFGISLNLLKTILLKYIPKMAPSNLNMENPVLYGIFTSFKSGIIKENEITNFLYYNQVFPDLSIEELMWNNLPNVSLEDKPKIDPEAYLEEEPLNSDLIVLSSEENLGVKLFPEDYNGVLTFYKGKRRIDQKSVSYDITESDLKYLLIFEVNLPVKSDIKEFVEKSAKIILKDFQKIKPKTSAVDQAFGVLQDLSATPKKKEFGPEKLVENSEIFYRIIIENSSFEIAFTKQDRDFGKVNGPITITAPQLFQEIKSKTLISTLISEDDLMYSVLELFNKFDALVN